MTELDTSAYTPAEQVTEDENVEEAEEEITRFQIPLDQHRKERLYKRINTIQQTIRNDTELEEKLEEIRELLERYDERKFLKMYVYECDKCGEVFETKQGIGVHHAMNPNCNGQDRPWQTGEPTFTRRRVEDELERENT